MSRITWGVDGYGQKHYLCEYCEVVFGDVDPTAIVHKCDKEKPQYNNRDKKMAENTHFSDGTDLMGRPLMSDEEFKERTALNNKYAQGKGHLTYEEARLIEVQLRRRR